MRAKEFIKELFEPQFKNTKKNVSHDLRALKTKANKPGTNAGSFGYVLDTPNDPGTVTKTAYDDDGGHPSANYKDQQKIDAYYIWVKLCARNNQMSANPYLPRVYVIDDREDENGLRVPRYQMEKLYAPTSDMINSDMLMAIASQIGVNAATKSTAWVKNIKSFYSTENEMSQDDAYNLERSIKSRIWDTIINAINDGDFDRSQDSLVEAHQLVNYIVQKWQNMNGEGVWEDMHSGNFMIRITNIGPQLVFTDPIAGAVPYSQVEEFLDGI